MGKPKHKLFNLDELPKTKISRDYITFDLKHMIDGILQ